MITRVPAPRLRPFIKVLWTTDPDDHVSVAERERVLPSGTMSIAFRLNEPLRIYDGVDDRIGRTVGRATVGGARSSPYVRDVSRPTRSVGAQLQPGVAEILLGVPAGELAEGHHSLEDVWGRVATEALERLAEAPTAAARMQLFEAALAARLPRVRGIHPAVAATLERLSAEPDTPVGHIVEATGYSHRRLLTLFHHAVGLTPKVYARVIRFQRAVATVGAKPMVEVALDAGYSDQPHFSREFRQHAGISPTQYARTPHRLSNHVPIVGSNPFKT